MGGLAVFRGQRMIVGLIALALLGGLLFFYYWRSHSLPVTMGYVEWVIVNPGHLKLKAKLDTGAATSSIRAEIVKTYIQDGAEWIHFTVLDKNGEKEEFDRPVKRWVRIKGKDRELLRRPVVELAFCMGKIHIRGEVNLAERENFLYPVLIGRNMLQGNINVNVSKTFTSTPRCEQL